MKKKISFPKIGQFRVVVDTVIHQSKFVGLDENKECIYNEDAEIPTLTFTGSVKLHGTNSGVSYNNNDGVWYQSSRAIITPEVDNCGFAFFAENRKDSFLKLFRQISNQEGIDLNVNTLTIYGEFVGKGIQKGMGINKIPEKSMFIFGVKVSNPEDKDFINYWLNCSGYRDPDNRIYNIMDYKTYKIDIDFSDPGKSQDELIRLTDQVEEQCPVSSAFDCEGMGEGIVWISDVKDLRLQFKVKGDKHKNVKRKNKKDLAPIDIEKLENVNEFIEYSVTEARLNQGMDITFPDGRLDIKKMGDFLRWLSGDIINEEGDTLSSNGLEPRDVTKEIANKGRIWFMDRYNKF
jgi:hypothetical protein